jgi:uncharacterized protein YfkK (UPF0435 family)
VHNTSDLEGRSCTQEDLVKLTVDERVAAGAALLDQILPGWEGKINIEVLDIGDSDACILGQLFDGSVPEGVADFPVGFRTDQALHNLGVFSNHHYEMMDYHQLTDAWRVTIQDRLNEQTSDVSPVVGELALA